MTANEDLGPGLLLTDMTCALPSEAWVSDKSCGPIPPKPTGAWRVLDYRCREYSGRLLTTCRSDAAMLRIPLNLTGWHAVSLGIGCPHGFEGVLDVRLSGDVHWQRMRVRGSEVFAVYGPDCALGDCRQRRRALLDREEPWTMADLTGRDLEVQCPRDLLKSGTKVVANLLSVRAIPMPDEHVRQITNDTSRKLVYVNDGHGIFFLADQPGPEIIERILEPFADSDWDTCCLGCGGADLVNYPSKRGTLFGRDCWDFPRLGDAIAAKMDAPLKNGWDPLKQAVDLAHAQGQEFWMYIRTQAWMADWPYDHAFRSRFYGEHLDCRCLEADGQPIAHLSIAYDAVREQLNGIAGEAIERGADGICLALVRGVPLVRYEQPVLDRFRELFGDDARSRPGTDPQLRTVWRDFVEQWLRELRTVLDRAPSAAGKRRKLSVICGADLEWNLRFGVDVGDLARKQLLDVVLPYPERRLVPEAGDPPIGNRYVPIEIDEYVRDLNDTGALILPSLGYYGDHALGLGEYRRRAHRFYQAGVHGLCRWDTDHHLARVGLNSPARVALWAEVYQPYDRPLTFIDIGGIPLGPFSSSVGT